MFQGLFNYDNPVWRFIGKLGDLVLLNLLWLYAERCGYIQRV